jgi:hypothetical protein
MFSPALRRSRPRDFGSSFGCHLIRARTAAFATERLSGPVLARIAHVLLERAGQYLGDADCVGDGIGGSFLALRSLWHRSSRSCLTYNGVMAKSEANE